MRALVSTNLAVRFVLELTALVALAYWGVTTVDGAGGWILGVAAAAAFALLWGVFVSPKARAGLRPPARLAVELGLFGVAAASLAAAGRLGLAVALAVVAVVSGILNLYGRSG